MKIDIFNHVMPVPYLDMMKQHLKDQGILKRMSNLRMLWDIEARVRMLDEKFPDVQQVLTLSLPSPELVGGPELAPELARIANDGMAGMTAKWPKKFPAFVASLPMNNVPAALEEMDRALGKLGARGVQICSSVNGRPLDDPEFFPVFERATNKHDVPIWMHPARPATRADYVGEQKSKYEIWQVLGWPFETSIAMARMVFSAFFEKLPGLRIITHHCGGMIPYFSGRAETLWAQLGSRTADENYEDVLKRMSKKPIEYFRMFYGDTVLGGSAAALRCGLDFFGADRVVFASDCPFDPEGGPMFIREGIRSVEDLKLSEADKRKIYFGEFEVLDRAYPLPDEHRPALGIEGAVAREHHAVGAEEIQPAAQRRGRAAEHGVAVEHAEILDRLLRHALEHVLVVFVGGAASELRPQGLGAARKIRDHSAA